MKIMTPKEKAEKLVSDFYTINCKLIKVKNGYDRGDRYNKVMPIAKESALISVNELIETEYESVKKLLNIMESNKIRLIISFNSDYWQEVKKEINKL